MTARFQRLADHADASIHHVGRRDHVGSRVGVRQGLLDQDFDGGVIGDVALFVEQPILAVAGVRVERDVGDDAEFGLRALERAYRALDQPVRIPGFIGGIALAVRADYREQRDRGDTECGDFIGLFEQQIDADALDARHRFDRFTLLFAVEDEHRVNEVVGAETMLAHQAPREIVSTHAAFAGIGVT
jgi:hypothetical protein